MDKELLKRKVASPATDFDTSHLKDTNFRKGSKYFGTRSRAKTNHNSGANTVVMAVANGWGCNQDQVKENDGKYILRRALKAVDVWTAIRWSYAWADCPK